MVRLSSISGQYLTTSAACFQGTAWSSVPQSVSCTSHNPTTGTRYPGSGHCDGETQGVGTRSQSDDGFNGRGAVGWFAATSPSSPRNFRPPTKLHGVQIHHAPQNKAWSRQAKRTFHREIC